MARKAHMRARHWGLLLAFLLMVVAPLGAIGYYLVVFATDQYVSVAGFSVQKENVGSPSELIGGLEQFVGAGGDSESDMLNEFIQSPDVVAAIQDRIDLRGHYTAHYDTDPVFSLKPGGATEDLVDYWQRIVRVSYDQSTGLVNLQVVAFSPEMAQRVAEELIAESQILVNRLNATARADTLKYAEQDLEEAVARLKDAREALVNFRTRTQIVDPESDLQGRMGVINDLQRQLAQALIDNDLVEQVSSPNDVRALEAQRRIEVIRKRISDERRTFAQVEGNDGIEGYPTLMAEYESLSVDREFAEQSYIAALASFDVARANAARQSRYLATYIRPTLPQKPEYPRRLLIFGLSAMFLLLAWMILSLMYYAIRDRK